MTAHAAPQLKIPRTDRLDTYLAKSSAGVHVTRLTSLRQAHALVPEWAELAEAAGGRNPFAHPDWLVPWAERFVRPSERIWLLAARQHGRLVGELPLL